MLVYIVNDFSQCAKGVCDSTGRYYITLQISHIIHTFLVENNLSVLRIDVALELFKLLQQCEIDHQQCTWENKDHRCNSCKVKPGALSFKNEGDEGNQ